MSSLIRVHMGLGLDSHHVVMNHSSPSKAPMSLANMTDKIRASGTSHGLLSTWVDVGKLWGGVVRKLGEPKPAGKAQGRRQAEDGSLRPWVRQPVTITKDLGRCVFSSCDNAN